MTETKQDQPPLLTKMAISELYFQLRGILSDPRVQQVMAKFTGPDKVYIPPEGVQELQDQLIMRVLEKVIPIAWWDWQAKQEKEVADSAPTDTKTSQQWAVWLGGAGPTNCKWLMERDDEGDAHDLLHDVDVDPDTRCGLAVRDVTRSAWREVSR